MLSTTQEAQEYRKTFHQYYYDKIVGRLNAFENARKPALALYMFWMSLAGATVIAAIGFIVYYCNTIPNSCWQKDGPNECVMQLGMFIVIGFCFLAKKVQKKFENEVKQGIIESFLSFFGDFRWSCKESISKEEIEESKLVGGITTVNSDDYFEGTHKDLRVIISEVQLIRGSGKNRSEIFKGLFIKLDMNKKFKSHTIITEDNILQKFFKPDASMQPVELEDVEFNKLFDVYSFDQTEARYILTTAFIERFKNLREIYKTKHIKASFLDNSVLIGLHCDRDMFKLGDLKKPVTDTGEFQQMFEEFIAVLSLVELLKLDMKTGL